MIYNIIIAYFIIGFLLSSYNMYGLLVLKYRNKEKIRQTLRNQLVYYGIDTSNENIDKIINDTFKKSSKTTLELFLIWPKYARSFYYQIKLMNNKKK